MYDDIPVMGTANVCCFWSNITATSEVCDEVEKRRGIDLYIVYIYRVCVLEYVYKSICNTLTITA